MNRQEVLAKTLGLVTGEREADYGSPEENFSRIAAMWTAYLGKDISTPDVAAMMALVKVARLANTPYHEDSWVDLAGYAACGGELSDVLG